MVLMDIALKDGSGLSVLKFIRNTPELRDLPVVAFTGQISPGILREAHDLGITAIYEKPSKFQDTVKLATEIFGRWATVVHTSK